MQFIQGLFLFLGFSTLSLANLNSFPPDLEGSYSIEFDCRDNPTSSRCHRLSGRQWLQMVRTEKALFLSLNERKQRMAFALFSVQTWDKDTGTLRGSSSGGDAEFSLVFNVDSNSLEMWIRFSEFPRDVRVVGIRKSSPGNFYHKLGAPEVFSPIDVLGEYKATPKGALPKLVVRLSALEGVNRWLSSWVHHSGAFVNYNEVSFDPEQGAFNFVESSANGARKLTLVYQETENGNQLWQGVAWSTYQGGFYEQAYYR